MQQNNNIWDTSHRPWPVPNIPWVMRQTWSNLLFAHYAISYDVLRKLVPQELPLDSFNGTYYIGVVPFQMSSVRFRGLPPVPGTDRFPELNVRTYVTLDGKPGIYFFSLDAENLPTVKGARAFFHLPYWYARMKLVEGESAIAFESIRKKNIDAKLTCSYSPISEPYEAEKGSLEEWMVERYCFYTLSKNRIPLRCDILHEPWKLQKAEARFYEHTILSAQGIDVGLDAPILHFAKKIEVRAWPLVHYKTNQLMI